MAPGFFNFSEKRMLIWLAVIGLFVWFLTLIQPILLPFVVGAMLAYFLDPVADRLERFGLSRTLSTAVIILSFFATVILLGFLLVPVIAHQLSDLAAVLPGYVQQLEEEYRPIVTEWLGKIGQDALANGNTALSSVSGSLVQVSGKFLKGVLASGITLLNLLSLLFITPVVSFYLLRDWDHIVARLDTLLPRAQADTIREQMRLIDRTLAGFMHGQINVCLFLGLFYSISLSLVGLPFAIVIGLGTGLLAIIPYAGALFGTAVGLMIAWFTFGDVVHVSIVLAIFLVGQALEGNFVTPKLVGEKVGLHPVWIIFGMLAGGALFGFVGILLAVPVTAIIGVLVRFAVGRYLESPLYSGTA